MLNTIRKVRDKDYQGVKPLSPAQTIEYYRKKAAGFDELIKNISRMQKKRRTR